MKLATQSMLLTGVLLAATLAVSSGCNEPAAAIQDSASSSSGAQQASANALPSGTRLRVTLESTLSSETASAHDSWHGRLAENVETRNGTTIAAGSEVTGVVAAAAGARRGSRAMLELSVRSIRVDGREVSILANGEPVIAGSTRTRNVGAVAGGAVAGALLGRAVGDGRNGAVGGVLGGAAAAGVVAGSKGYQVELKAGTTKSFTVSHAAALR